MLKKIKYQIFDRYTLVDKVVSEYNEEMKMKYDKTVNNNSNAFCFMIVSFVQLAPIVSIVKILDLIKNIKIFKGNIIEEIIHLLILFILILSMTFIISKIFFWLIKEPRKDEINYYDYCKEGMVIFLKLLKNYWKNILLYLLMLIVILILFIGWIFFIDKILFKLIIVFISLIAIIIIKKCIKNNENLKEVLLLFFIILMVLQLFFLVNIMPSNKNLDDFIEFLRNKNFLERIKCIWNAINFSWYIGEIMRWLAIVNLVMGNVILHVINKKYSNESKKKYYFIFSLLTIWIILCGIISFISTFFSDKLIYPLNTLLSMFISLLIINKLINKLKSFKEKKEKIRIERIGILINILKINKIKEEKYEDLVMNIEKKLKTIQIWK